MSNSPTRPNFDPQPILATPVDVTDETQEVFAQQDEVAHEIGKVELKEIKRRSVSGAMAFFIRTAILNGIGLVANLVLSLYLTQSDFGIYGIVNQIIGLLVFFSDIGLAATLIQKKVEPSLTDYRTAFTVQQILSWVIVIASVVLISTQAISQKTGPAGNWLLLSLALSFPLSSLKTISSIMLERKLEFSKIAVPQIIEQIVFQGLLILLALRGFGVMSYAYAIIARSVVGVIVMWLIQPWSIGLTWNTQAFKALASFGAKFQLNDFLARIKDQLFYLVLGYFLPLNQFGIISWAKQWSMYPYNLTVQNVITITFPTFSRLQDNPAALKKAIEKTIFFITLIIFPLLAVMCAFITPLTQVVVNYQKWQPAILSFVFFTLSIGWAAVSTPLTNTLNAIGRINTSLKLMILWLVLTWVLTPLAIWQFGFNGVAIASLLISFTSILPVYYVKQSVPIKIWPSIWRQLLAAVMMAAVGVAGVSWWNQSLLWLLTGMGISGLVYVATLAAIGFKTIKAEVLSLRS